MKIFQNLDPNIKPRSFFEILKWKLGSKQPIWPKYVPLDSTDTPPKIVNNDKIRISFVGHVTFLIQINGLNILTDPVWSDRASPLPFGKYKRVTPPGINFDDLPKIDIVLISHNHYDHMDIKTIKKLWLRDKPKIITPLMNEKILESHILGIKVTSLAWFEKINFTQEIGFALEPAQHWSARGLFDKNKALWGTFIITSQNGSICFIGDSGYNADIFKNIGIKYPNILISLIPIGAFEPRWFMKDVHINPEEAVLIHQHLNSKYSIASHFATFQLADDTFEQAANELEQARINHKISDKIFITPKIAGVYWFNINS